MSSLSGSDSSSLTWYIYIYFCQFLFFSISPSLGLFLPGFALLSARTFFLVLAKFRMAFSGQGSKASQQLWYEHNCFVKGRNMSVWEIILHCWCYLSGLQLCNNLTLFWRKRNSVVLDCFVGTNHLWIRYRIDTVFLCSLYHQIPLSDWPYYRTWIWYIC